MNRYTARLVKLERWHAATAMAKDWPTIRRRWEQRKARLVADLEAWEAGHPLTLAEGDQRNVAHRSLAERWARRLGVSATVLKDTCKRRMQNE